MKILLTHRFFWPDTAPYATILRSIGDCLADAGREDHTFSSVASYRARPKRSPRRERLGKVEIHRVWVFLGEKNNLLKRLANIVIYCISLFFEILRQKPDVVTASTFPPVVAGWTASSAARLCGAKFIYHVQDIHPEVSIYSRSILGWALPARLLTVLDNQTLRRADAIVTLSEDMAQTLRDRGLGKLPITIVSNPPLESHDEPIAPPINLIKAPGTVRVIFAGNLGRFQNLPLIAEGIAKCFDAHPELELMFLGDGMALAGLKTRWGDHPQVRFVPHLPFAQARSIIADADIGLVSLSPNIFRVAYPSKLSTYLDLGLTVLAVIEPESQLAQRLEASGLGTVAASAEPETIRESLNHLLSNTKRQPQFVPAPENSWLDIVAAVNEA